MEWKKKIGYEETRREKDEENVERELDKKCEIVVNKYFIDVNTVNCDF